MSVDIPSEAVTTGNDGATIDAQHAHKRGFPWRPFLVSILALLGGHWLGISLVEIVSSNLDIGNWGSAVFAVIALLALIACVVVYYRLHHSNPDSRNWVDKSCRFLLQAGIAASGVVFAEQLAHFLLHGPPHVGRAVPFFLLGSLAMLLLGSLLASKNWLWERPQELSKILADDIPKQIKELLLFVSPSNKTVQISSNPVVFDGPRNDENPTGTPLSLGSDLGGAVRNAASLKTRASMRTYWNWEQILRAIRPHEALSHVVLVGSTGPRGSHKDLPACQAMIKLYRPDVTVEADPNAIDFQDGHAVESTAGHWAKFMRARVGVQRRVAIDITGGLSISSYVAGAMTMNRELVMQYVTHGGEVYLYDFVYSTGPSAGGH